MDGIENRHRHPVADAAPPRRSLGAGVGLQCERTGEALIQALRDDVRLLTLLKSELDVKVELGLLNTHHNS